MNRVWRLHVLSAPHGQGRRWDLPLANCLISRKPRDFAAIHACPEIRMEYTATEGEPMNALR